jgi:predicted O-linked N-acetylglucosamine transferase (SPINDLY family)
MASKRASRSDYQRAVEARATGQFDLARELLVALVQREPAQRSALAALSELEVALGRYEPARAWLLRLVELVPSEAAYHLNLGEVERRLGNGARALASFQRALELKPGFAEAMINLGVLLCDAGEPGLALRVLDGALDVKFEVPEVQLLFGRACSEAGEQDLAELHQRCAALLREQRRAGGAVAARLRAEANEFASTGGLRHAVACYQAAIAVQPSELSSWLELGACLRRLGRAPGALLAARRAVALRAKDELAAALLCATLADTWQIEEALVAGRRAVTLHPGQADAHFHYARALLGSGEVPEAVAALRHAVALDAQHYAAHGALVFCLPYLEDATPCVAADEARAWSRAHAPAPAQLLHANTREPDRKLRLGYVSEDFRRHPLANFIVPVLEGHDRSAFEVFCYSSVRRPDDVTERVKGAVANYRDVAMLGDAALASAIRDDAIDVLVDLSLFSGESRLRALARAPAPVQLTYLAYLGTSGLATVQYRITAPGLDDPRDGEGAFSEAPLRLPDCYWCYDPLDARGLGAASALAPAARTGHVTFGSQNSFHKLSEACLALWARVLSAEPTSRLVAHAPPAAAPRVLRILSEQGVAPARITLLPRRPRREYLEAFRDIDLCLDTLPFNGVTTTLDACWMGTPTLTLTGDRPAGRAAASLWRCMDLPELVAESPDDFVVKALTLTRDLNRLGELRHALRGRLQGSPLMDAERFVRALEALYRRAWRTYCAEGREAARPDWRRNVELAARADD